MLEMFQDSCASDEKSVKNGKRKSPQTPSDETSKGMFIHASCTDYIMLITNFSSQKTEFQR